MPKSRGRKPHKRSSHRSGPAGRPQHRQDHEPDLLDQVAEALETGHPLPLLGLVSGLLDALDPRNDNPFDRSTAGQRPSVDTVLDFMAGQKDPAATALAWTSAHLVDDDLLRARTLRTIGAGSFLLPRWLHELSRVQVVAAAQLLDEFRDVANVFVHVRLAEYDLTAVTLVDFNLGTIVKNNFFADQPLSAVEDLWRQHEGGGVDIEPLSLADARARLTDAIEIGARTWPREETEDWPQSRPLLEWVMRQLPAGGTGFDQPQWSEAGRNDLVDRFLASPYAQGLDRPDDRGITDDLAWYRTDYGYGDPLRWSGAAVEILMLDWYPRKIVADGAYLQRMPEVLRQFIRFGHAEAGLDPAGTELALSALDQYEQEYLDAVSRPRRQGPAALMERMGVLDPLDDDSRDDDLLDLADLNAFSRAMLAELVGGAEQLDTLTEEPLPDEPFETQGIPDGIAERVAETVTLVDGCCAELLDTEHRTAARRLLHDVAVADPRSFTGRAKPRTAAAAVCWMIGRANETVGYAEVSTSELMAWFGLKAAPSSRADSIRRALGLGPVYWPGALGSPRYLVGKRRAQLIRQRDQDLGRSR